MSAAPWAATAAAPDLLSDMCARSVGRLLEVPLSGSVSLDPGESLTPSIPAPSPFLILLPPRKRRKFTPPTGPEGRELRLKGTMQLEAPAGGRHGAGEASSSPQSISNSANSPEHTRIGRGSSSTPTPLRFPRPPFIRTTRPSSVWNTSAA